MSSDKLKRTKALFISLDPEKDNPEKLKQYTNYFHPNILGLTEDIKVLTKVAEQYGVNYQKKYIEFNSIIKTDLLEEDKIKKTNLKRNSPACIIYTSGTGGNPKGVILSHGGILNNLEGANEILEPIINKYF